MPHLDGGGSKGKATPLHKPPLFFGQVPTVQTRDSLMYQDFVSIHSWRLQNQHMEGWMEGGRDRDHFPLI